MSEPSKAAEGAAKEIYEHYHDIPYYERGLISVIIDEAMKPEREAADKMAAALKRFASIEVPPTASAGTWVAKTIYCNTQVTALQVKEAKAAIEAWAKARGA